MLPSLIATDLTPCFLKNACISFCTFGFVVTSVATQRSMIASAVACMMTPAAIFFVLLSSGPYRATVPRGYCRYRFLFRQAEPLATRGANHLDGHLDRRVVD